MKGFKTALFGVLIAALSVLSSPEMQQFVADNLPEVGASIGTLIIVLRALTNSPMFKSAQKEETDA